MAIEIIIEDGTGVAGANSYVSVADARTYAANRGIVLSANDDEVAAMLIQASDYLEAQSCKYQGSKTDCAQALEWPRSSVVICSIEIATTAIPKQLVSAQILLAIAVSQGLSLQPNIGPQDYVTEETVGPLTTKYANPVQTGISTRFTGVDALLEPLFFASCGQVGFAIKTMRV